MPRAPLLATFVAGFVALSALPAAAERFAADYHVTLYGLPVAKAYFVSSFEGDSFRIDGSLSSAGVARLFDRTTGTTSVTGVVGGDGVSPRSYVVEYRSGDEQKMTAISFSGDRVSDTVNKPAPKKRGADWVALSEDHLRTVLDPISSTLIRADSPAEVCNRNIRVYDGEMRADLQLSHVRTGKLQGFEGEGVTCSARFIPVAGYRKGRSSIEYLRSRSRITLSLMPLGDTGFYAPVDASIGTRIGTLRVRAEPVTPR